MRWADRKVRQVVVNTGLGVFLGSCSLLAGAQTTPGNTVPDAPRPQSLPTLNTITPTAPAVPNAPLPNAPAAQAADPNQIGSTLPSTPSTTLPSDAEDVGPPPEQHAANIRVSVNLVTVPFTVKDSKGNLVPGLTYRDVRVYENGLRQRPVLFSVDPIPLSVAIVIDQSVTFDTMKKINASLEALQGAFTPYDEVAIYTYNNGVREQTSFSGAQTARITYALERSKSEGREPNMGLGGGPLEQTTVKNNLPVDPNTNRNSPAGVLIQNAPREYHTLNDAIFEAGEGLSKAAKGRRRVIYVITDGKEYGSKATQKEVIRYLQTNQISVYGTLVGDSAIPGLGFLDRIHLPLQMRDDVLPKYTDATGGQCDPEMRPRGIQDSFAKLAEQVRIQYTIGYYSHESFLDSKFRPYEVRVMRPSLDVIAPKGYYPNASQARPNSPVPAVAPSGSGGGTGTPTPGVSPSTP